MKIIYQTCLLFLLVVMFAGCANPQLETITYTNRNLTDQQRRELSKACFLALQREQEDVAIMTIKQGAYINWREEDQGWTLLIAAIYFEEDDVAEFLIDCGADLNLTDYSGRTPLMWAAIRDNEDIAEKLVEKGAKIDIFDFKKLNAIQYAAIHDADGVAEMLLEVKAMRYRKKLKEQNEAIKRRAAIEHKLAMSEAIKAQKAGKKVQKNIQSVKTKQVVPVKKTAPPEKTQVQDKAKKPKTEKTPNGNIPVMDF